ncbi:ImmA/IrrE family metallo-endopeptidase [Oceanobacillus polygoni]|uniref:Zn-dependent peptidase ImmA (M78 family) n=1 Tax=Oceanobacillus polygoni TaxID=1235259 RepID=A0A9X1CDB8_9BACI|nr:ImmA/IrrE family metallo-endopeptidase [Oceanobacillus polygoni]MBP2079629.1 Zn-dependent peptidase ImmA (M78 family) [Oceanobacillus polygoni]
MKYQSTLLEDAIKKFYNQLNIHNPSQLDMREIAKSLNIPIHFLPIHSRTYNGEIIIDSRLPPEIQWEDFGHELCHILLQYGNQIININTLFLEYQEWKANNFALHFCVPTFMLQKYKISTINEGIYIIKNKFNVTDEIAKKRLNHYRNQLIQSNSKTTYWFYK